MRIHRRMGTRDNERKGNRVFEMVRNRTSSSSFTLRLLLRKNCLNRTVSQIYRSSNDFPFRSSESVVLFLIFNFLSSIFVDCDRPQALKVLLNIPQTRLLAIQSGERNQLSFDIALAVHKQRRDVSIRVVFDCCIRADLTEFCGFVPSSELFKISCKQSAFQNCVLTGRKVRLMERICSSAKVCTHIE